MIVIVSLIGIDFYNLSLHFLVSFCFDGEDIGRHHVLPHFQTPKILRWVLFFQLSS